MFKSGKKRTHFLCLKLKAYLGPDLYPNPDNIWKMEVLRVPSPRLENRTSRQSAGKPWGILQKLQCSVSFSSANMQNIYLVWFAQHKIG